MHLRPHRGVNAIGTNQDRPFYDGGLPIRIFHNGRDGTVWVRLVAGNTLTKSHRVYAKTFLHFVKQQHLQFAAMGSILGPSVASF